MNRPFPLFLRRAWRRLLELDRFAPRLSEAELAAEVERHYRWNFAVNLMDVASFFFGLSFMSSATIVPLFISKLSDSPLPVGLAAVIAQSAWFLPQLFTANAVERLARKKPVVVNLGLFLERLPIWFLVAAAVLAAHSAGLALIVFLLAYAWHGLGAGVVATGWQDLIARCFPVERRGRFFGISMFLGTGVGTLSAAISTWILDAFAFPTNFGITFTLAAIFISLSWFFLSLTREPAHAIDAAAQTQRQFWAQLPDIPRRDRNFRRFLIARSVMALGGLASGFITVSAIARWQVPDSMAGAFTAVLLLGQTFGNLVFGFLADRFGHKLSLELGALASSLAFVVAWLAPSVEWYYLVFALNGVNLGAVFVSGVLVIMEFSDPARRPTYIGLANTVVGLTAVVAPLVGSALAGVDYRTLFVVAALLNTLAGVALRWWVKEPRWHRPPGRQSVL